MALTLIHTLFTLVDPLGLETCVLVTRNLFGFGNHAALHLSLDNTLYDPNGDLAAKNGGGEVTAGSIDDFTKHHKANYGDSTEKSCKKTTKEEEAKIQAAIDTSPGSPALGCATSVSSVLIQSRVFSGINETYFFPGDLIDAFNSSSIIRKQ